MSEEPKPQALSVEDEWKAALKRVAAMKAENKRYADALKVYAARGNWTPNETEDLLEGQEPTQDQWRGPGDGWDVASEALKPGD